MNVFNISTFKSSLMFPRMCDRKTKVRRVYKNAPRKNFKTQTFLYRKNKLIKRTCYVYVNVLRCSSGRTSKIKRYL